MGKHGLFTDGGVEVDLDKVSEELNNYNSYAYGGYQHGWPHV